MSKRSRDEENTDRPPKRAKAQQAFQAPPVEEIHYARQLQQALVFRQDGIQQLRTGIASFKAFLESILYHRDEEDRARQLSILREFLDSQKPDDPKDTENPFLAQLWQAWSFASQNNNDHVSSAVSSIFALLLRTLSSLLDFREHGILLCRTVLLHQHLRLVKRGLDAPKHKEFIIAPCLRLLTEASTFDGGALAREVYKRREFTFDISTLRRNLGLVRNDVPEEEARRRPSIRALTVRYVLAHLKYLHEGGKIDILKSRPLCIALFQHVGNDPADLINEILYVTEQNVLRDNDLPRSAKSMLLTQHNLERITDVATRADGDHPAAERAFAWLTTVCSVASYGILRASGWYPAGTTKLDTNKGDSDGTIDLGLDSLDFYDRSDRVDVRNSTLLGWLHTLRPHADAKERELVITCFESAPELVAAFFAEKNMPFEPKLSNTWIGYASFMFEVIRLSIPDNIGDVEGEDRAELPPQTSIMLASLLPKPLTQKVLTRCLNQNSELIAFFAVRLLVLAFQKAKTLMAQLREAAGTSVGHGALWHEAADRLLARFIDQVPSMEDVISLMRKTPDDDQHVLQREGVTRLLQLYYEVTPVKALEEQLDVSIALATALGRSAEVIESGELSRMRSLDLRHLLVIAKSSTSMRWFNKQGTLAHSPITTLLKLHTTNAQDTEIRQLIWHVMSEHDLLGSETELKALLASLSAVGDDEVWDFLDDCLLRSSKQPVKYVDQLEEALRTWDEAGIMDVADGLNDDLPGLLVAAVVEQVAFATGKDTVQRWTARFLTILVGSMPVKSKALVTLQLQVKLDTEIDEADEWILEEVRQPVAQAASATHVQEEAAQTEPQLLQSAPPIESQDHPQLLRWAQKDLELALEEGDIDALILCLCSSHEDVRKQAHVQIKMLNARLQSSSIEDKGHLGVLIGSLLESYGQQCLTGNSPLTYIAGTFATRSLHVLLDPTHFLYPKLNRYLMKSPSWRLSRLPTHWLSETMLSQPEEDDAYWKETQWVLDWLNDGLRTPQDLEVLRKGSVFEKIMALTASPAAWRIKEVKERMLEMVYRASCIDGGSSMLITRTGVLAWLDMLGGGKSGVAALLKTRVLETCDQKRVSEWKGVGVAAV